MKCISCDSRETKVVESRKKDFSIRRRRECLSCKKRFSTVETLVSVKNKQTKPLVSIRRRSKEIIQHKEDVVKYDDMNEQDFEDREFIEGYLKGKL